MYMGGRSRRSIGEHPTLEGMSNPNHDTDLDTSGLLDRLKAARRRLDLRRALAGAAWSALAAAMLVALVEVTRLVTGGSAISPGSPGGEWGWAAAVLVAGLAATALWSWRSRPDLLEMARRADRHFGLDDRLGTAVEMGARPASDAPRSPVVAALFRDAAAHGARIDPRRLVPIGLPRPAVALGLVALAIVGLELASPAARSTSAPGASILAAVAESDAAAAAELIMDIAALMREVAERDSDEYLRVVATSLEQLAADVIEQQTGGQAAADELGRLLSRAESASGLSETEASSEGFSLTLAGIEDMLRTEAEMMADLVARADASTRESEAGEYAMDARTMPSTVSARARAVADSLRAARERALPDSAAALELAAADSSASGSMSQESDGSPSMEAQAAAGERSLANVDLSGGVSTMETETNGASAAEGLGGGSRLAPAERIEVMDVASTRDFELPMEGGSRRRLPEEIVPQTRFTEVDESPLPRGDWRQTTQEHLSSGYLGVSYRDVASRYFLSRIRMAEAEAEAAGP